MPERPSAAELLDIATRVLREQLLDALPRDARYPALMVANAMAIAGREIAAREDAADPAGTRALTELLGVETDTGAAARADPAALARRLAQALRLRELDPADRRLRALLLQQTVAALRISNPRHLAGYGLA